MTQRSEGPWVVATGVVGIVGIAVVGLSWIGLGVEDLVLLLPLAVLIAGLAWSLGLFDPQAPGARTSENAPLTSQRTSIAPSIAPTVTPGGALIHDVPTVTAGPAEPEGVAEVVRQAAAATFDLQSLLVDETPDRVQCANCGRYNALDSPERGTIRCRMCGASRRLTAIQPDTRVRMFIDDDHTRQVPVLTLTRTDAEADAWSAAGPAAGDVTAAPTTPMTGPKGD